MTLGEYSNHQPPPQLPQLTVPSIQYPVQGRPPPGFPPIQRRPIGNLIVDLGIPTQIVAKMLNYVSKIRYETANCNVSRDHRKKKKSNEFKRFSLVINSISINSGKFCARRNIPAGDLIFADYPIFRFLNFVHSDSNAYKLRLIGVKSGVNPPTWTCVTCMKAVGPIVPKWCPNCDLPICEKCISVKAKHDDDSLCHFASQHNIRGRRFWALSDVYMDVALTRFLMLRRTSPSFDAEINQIVKNDIRTRHIAIELERTAVWQRFLNPEVLPLAYAAARGDDTMVLVTIAFLINLRNHLPSRPEIGIFHPIFGRFGRNNRNPNSKIYMSECGGFEIRTTRTIEQAHSLTLGSTNLLGCNSIQ